MKTLDGKSFLIRVQVGDLVQDLKEQIQNRFRIPMKFQNMIYSSRFMQDDFLLQDYDIEKNPSIIINL